MRWYRPLYLSKNTADQIDKIREKATAGAWVPGIYFVTLSSEPGHLLDLFHNTMLKESIFREVDIGHTDRLLQDGLPDRSDGDRAAHGGEDRKG